MSAVKKKEPSWLYTNLLCWTKAFVLILVPLSLAHTLEKGTIHSGLTYGGISYKHILVEEPRGRVSKCFSLIATKRRVKDRLVKQWMRTQSLAKCEDACLRATFTCRGFNYRYETASFSRYLLNCELSTQDSYGVSLDDSLVFSSDPQFDFFERKSFGIQCDGKSVPRTFNDNGYNIMNIFDYGNSFGRERFDRNRYGNKYNNINNYYINNKHIPADCFRLLKREYRLDNRGIKERQQVRDIRECQNICTSARNFVCHTIAYRNGQSGSSWFSNDNCFLSDLKANNISHYDIIYDRSYDVYTIDQFNNQNCLSYNSEFNTGVSSGYGAGYNGGYGYGNRPFEEPNYNAHGREERFETASGFPCYMGGCREARFGHFYFCDTDANGGWDYCCRPNDHCEKSSEYPLRWCYVGVLEKDQWRPCNMNAAAGLGRRAYLKKPAAPNMVKLLEDPKPHHGLLNSTLSQPSNSNKTEIELSDLVDLG